jgi:hypothetical protein
MGWQRWGRKRKPLARPISGAAQKSGGGLAEKVWLVVLDKAVLGFFIVFASAVASAVFGAKLEGIKTADAQLLELTKRRIDATNRTYERITKSIADADDDFLKAFDALVECGKLPDEEPFSKCRTNVFWQLPDVRRALYYTTEPNADDMWIEPELRKAMNDYRAKADDYRKARESFVSCVGKESWKSTQQYTLGMGGLASVCFSEAKAKRDVAMSYRDDLQKAVDRYVDRSTVPPSIARTWFGLGL